MKHTGMPVGYKIPENYEQVGTARVVGQSPYSSSGIGATWAVVELKLLGFHCVTATLDRFWKNYLVEGIDQDLIKTRRRK